MHLPMTGQMNSPATADLTRRVSLKLDPMRVGSNVTSTSDSIPSGPAGWATMEASVENPASPLASLQE